MEVSGMQAVMTLLFAIMSAVVYSVWNYITKTDPGAFEVRRVAASVIFGLFIGAVMVYQEVPIEQISWETIGMAFITFNGVLLYINRGIDWVWQKFTGAKVLEPKAG